ncbi:ABC transporter permease [Salsipaludibacter albus]|uniref:ABC transporter permease n=1 Tax=Salsipaludibacter albus TaxID=2849650 RepID=UPI001EE4971A|nr:ABC transporter permease subunit [Salsipaludibacter albus]MBY5162139.1 ABC transporter permease [Salsipaludibacter albus]
MSTLTRPDVPATTTTPVPDLVPVVPGRAPAGLANLVRKELGQWFGTRLWAVQLVLWVLILNGITTAVMLDPSMPAGDVLAEAVLTFLQVAAALVAIGVVLTTQGAIIGERELGTAAWVLSKPASRTSFLAAKLTAHLTGFGLLALAIPAIVFAVTVGQVVVAPMATGRFALGVAVAGLAVVFYLVLTLALGTVFRGRGPVAGVGVGLVLAGLLLKGMLPPTLVVMTPWLLGDVGASLALGTTMEVSRATPIVATSTWTVLLLVLAWRRFRREEF